VKQIMQGIRVLEVATWTYVPAAGAVLAEWGADVVKIEHPETGDPQRGLVSMGLVPTGPGGINHMIELPNRGKRSVGLDLKSDEGHELLLKLASTADVFLTSFLPGVRRSLRIDVDDIRAANTDIIYVRGSGNGPRGPEADRGGYDGSNFWHRVVADIITREGDYPVPPPGPAFGDLLGAMTIAGGISAALFHRERTGEALVVDNSLLANGMWATGASILSAGMFGISKLPMGDRANTPNPLVNTYRTADGRHVSLMMLQGDRFWPSLVAAIGHPELAEDARFADSAARFENRHAAVAALDEIFATKTYDEWRAELAGIDGVWTPVQQSAELLDDPQVVANNYVAEIEHSGGTTFRMVPSPIQFDEEPAELTRAPEHGEHTDEVLLELGFTMDEILEFKINNVIV
jgi:crotonobetainyl-CoA:carnitine CoA-transferase CaiB-like acyl-CoA transferase